MRKLRLLWLIAAALLPTGVQAQSNDVPYLYYYSLDQSAFMLERANGTDSQILADFALGPHEWEENIRRYEEPAALTYGIRISGPGWSPSGNWFAWSSSSSQESVIINPTNEIILELGEGNLEWSPRDDVLLFNQTWGHNNDGGSFQNPCLLNLAWPKHPLRQCFENLARGWWSPDGNYFVAMQAWAWQEQSPQIYLHSGTGDLIGQRSALSTEMLWYRFWLTDSVLIYTARESVVIENLSTQTAREFSFPFGSISQVQSSPDHRHVAFQKDYWNQGQFEGHQLFLLDVGTLEIVPVTLQRSAQETAFQFLPDNTLVLNYEGELYQYDTREHQLQNYPLSLPSGITFFRFSPDRHYIALWTGEPEMLLFDTESQQLTAIHYENPELPEMNDFGNFMWHPDSKWLLTTSYTSNETLVGVVDAVNGTIRPLGICSYSSACFGWLP